MSSKEILRDLISFNTINDKENKAIINYIEKYLKNIGFTTEYKSNCLVIKNKENCNIGFLGHTDTVSHSNYWSFNPLELTEENGKLYGLGTCDMKGAIAAILSAISKVDFSSKETGIKLFFTYDEEIGFAGINELINNKMDFPKYMIIGEPTNNEIINGSKGLLEFKITFKGVSAHSSNPQDGINAIEKCIKFINELKSYYNDLKNETIDRKSATMNIGVINGGRAINIIPDSCEVLIDFRTVYKNQNANIIKKINKLLKDSNASYEIINNINPFANDSEEINMSNFITEASFIESGNKYILGVGPMNAHKTDEFITIDSLNKLEEQYLKMINEKCN